MRLATLGDEFISVANLILSGCWAIMCLVAVAPLVIPLASVWHRYGKLRSDPSVHAKAIFDWTVPKRWFLHFYVVGVGLNIALLLAFKYCGRDTPVPTVFHLLHCTRRLYEELRMTTISRNSSSQMHLGGYLVGMAFYVGSPISLAATEYQNQSKFKTIKEMYNGVLYTMMLFIGLGLVILGSSQQASCHKILFLLKQRGLDKPTTNSKHKHYSIPRGAWFEYVSSPHYLSEIIIYTGLLLIHAGFEECLLTMMLFIVLNLWLTANRTHQWYQKTFGPQYPSNRTPLFPGVRF